MRRADAQVFRLVGPAALGNWQALKNTRFFRADRRERRTEQHKSRSAVKASGLRDASRSTGIRA
jgi:hypothetical protein